MFPFVLSPLEGDTAAPQWTGCDFLVGGKSTPVLEYSGNDDGWTDELTNFHEETLGDAHPIDQASRADALRQLGLYASGRKNILEVGCSSGYLLSELKRTFPEAFVMGADVVRQPLFRLARRLPGVPLFRFDMLRCPLPDACVDAVVMLNVLEHIEADCAAMAQALRILKPGGVVIVEVPSGPRLYDGYDRALKHFRRYGAGELRRKLTSAGFEVVRSSHLGCFVYPAFAAVKLLNRCRGEQSEAVHSGASFLVRAAFRLESSLGRIVSYPFGIRCLAVGRKPARKPGESSDTTTPEAL